MVEVLKTRGEALKAIEYEGLVVIDFFAVWCPPCKAIAPTYEKFPQEYPEARFYKVDVEENTQYSKDKEVTAMPTFIFYKNGEEVARVVGADLHKIRKNIEKYQ